MYDILAGDRFLLFDSFPFEPRRNIFPSLFTFAKNLVFSIFITKDDGYFLKIS
jgi:hypothetical protein